MLDVICRIGRQLGRRFSAMQPLHTLRVIQQHPVLQIHDPLWRGQQLTLPDVGFAERERIVYLHTALNSRAGGQRHRDDKEIFPLARRLLRSCGGKPNQRDWEAMLGRKYVPPVLKKGAFTMDNTAMEMKDDSLIMKIMFKAVAATIARGFGGKKDYENPEFRMLMNSSAGRIHPRCSAEVRMAKALLYFFRDRAAMKQSGRRTAGAAVRLGCIFRRKNRRIAYRASKEAGEINENHFSWNRRGGFSAVACGYRPVYGQQRHPALHGDAARRRYRHVGRYRVSCADTPCGKASEWAGIQFFT